MSVFVGAYHNQGIGDFLCILYLRGDEERLREILRSLIDNAPQGVHLEVRYHQRKKEDIRVDKGVLRTADSDNFAGVGIRALVDGTWGFASTSIVDKSTLSETMNDAITAAKMLSVQKSEKTTLAPIKPIEGTFSNLGKNPLSNHSLEERVELALSIDKLMQESDKRIKGTVVLLEVVSNHRFILNSDGSDVEIRDTRPQFVIRPVASEGGKMMPYLTGRGITGGWEIFQRDSLEIFTLEAAEIAVTLLDAPLAKGGKHTVVMEPSVVGIICHEAIGHTVEADLVAAGSAAKGKIGEKVASEHVTMIDSGEETEGSGWLPVDDAGVQVGKTVIIEKGIMKSFLHSRSSAYDFETEPTGNERAFEYDVEPLIRMRNTYLAPGDFTHDELIEDVKFGYLLAFPGGGQADSTAEFMFGVPKAYEIVNGSVTQLVKNVTITGNAYEVLSSVDGVAKDWKLDMGAGLCGKTQFAKVDGGGAVARTKALVAGEVGGA
ncbi:MAG: TldD/PmbA family protein [Candidatus Thorarchaeota archaeon]